LIVVHGVADPEVPTLNTIAYYVNKKIGALAPTPRLALSMA